MNEPLVYDATAMLALFRGDSRAYLFWEEADRGDMGLVFPAAAVAEANRWLQASWDAWATVIWPERIDVAPLDTSAALDSVRFAGGLATAHVIREARQLDGAILTARPQDYTGQQIPVITI